MRKLIEDGRLRRYLNGKDEAYRRRHQRLTDCRDEEVKPVRWGHVLSIVAFGWATLGLLYWRG